MVLILKIQLNQIPIVFLTDVNFAFFSQFNINQAT